MTDHFFSLPDPSATSRAVEAVESLSDGILAIDRNLTVIYMNPAAARLTGWSWQEALGRPASEVFRTVGGTNQLALSAVVEAVLKDDRERSLPLDTVLIRRDGVKLPIEDAISPVHDRLGAVAGAVINFRNASLARILLLKAVHQAHHDPLTDLPNRMILEDRIGQAIASLSRHPHLIGLLYLDLDGFKAINDSRGHGVGDAVLRAVARRLKGVVRGSDTVCRLGGDEFVILLPELPSPEALMSLADLVLASMRMPILVDGETLNLTASIGAVLQKRRHLCAGELLQEGDAAMYAAKQAGGNRVHSQTSATSSFLHRSINLEAALCRALTSEEFRLLYQPQVDLETGRICGVEALLRWQTPDGKLLTPSSFIPVAERSELIIPIGQWVLKEAIRQQVLWRDDGFPEIMMSVNVSPMELRQPGYYSHLESIIQQAGANPGCALLELTESVLRLQTEEKRALFSSLKKTGIRLGIDDFGIGYSNLAYIRDFPIDVIKINSSFIADCTSQQQDASLVRAIINMGRSLHKGVIAEGIETKEQMEFLKGSHCRQGQGYYFSPPITAEALSAVLAEPNLMQTFTG
ncbi:putative bifunctional diguanylate cyclase/phosphodiesterase [Terriglobus roseus]|uniref:PAS domain S-box-containing protein/diguanylate cyclase (GGDEF) domain-containing protein n=1 Tax=Terriglobus roseus TaxID=392734 RepID=A0A1H4J6L1_9BACT|nr:GGDEF domain-containing phosphodiesterase [Terriglobus roseus]SEB41903.1 PAS domain S-box-containing protein/diguanylate cyclase (GGDEF) domain-containing protein [Terriglobus roseus]